MFSQLILILYHKYPLMSNQYIKGESVLRFYIFKVLLNVIRRKKKRERERKRGKGKGRGRGKGEKEKGEGEEKGKRQKKIPRKFFLGKR